MSDELFEKYIEENGLPENWTGHSLPKSICMMLFKAGVKAVIENLPAYKETKSIDSREKFMVFGFNICIDEIKEKFKEK
jgi:hypothetical protein